MKTYLMLVALLLAVPALTSCATDPNVQRGRTTGAIVGGIAGGLIDDSWGGAAVGAAAGTLIGGEIGRYQSGTY